MANALKIINARAKVLRRKNKKLTHIQAIKKASADYRAGRKSVGKVKKSSKAAKLKKPFKQYGATVTHNDKARAAKKPGYRKSASGNMYLERRKNRSDAPGKLTGINSNVPTQLANEMRLLQQSQALLWKVRNTSKRGLSSLAVGELKRQKAFHLKAIQVHKANIRNLKRLI